MKLIQSRENSFFKELLKLISSSRQRGKSGLAVLDGAHLLAACLDSKKQPEQVFINAAALHDAEASALLQRTDAARVTQLDDKLFAELSDLKTPTGILSLIKITEPEAKISTSRFAVLLEDIQDPGNVGSILRSAAAAGCDTVFLSQGCADAWSPKVLRAAMGGHFCLNIYEQQNLSEVANNFSGALLATSLQATNTLYQCDLRANLALMVGNEGAGLSAELRARATQNLRIPMPGKMESLNVAAATAICLFEAVRQRASI